MEGGEAAPRVDNKKEKNNKNNSRLPKSINFLTSILYFFFYLIGFINITGYMFELILVYLDKFSFVLTFILIFFISLIMAQSYFILAFGKKVNNLILKEKIFVLILSFILVFIFYHIKLASFIEWSLSSILNLLIKCVDIFKYVAFLPLCKFTTITIIEFIKK